MLQSFAYAQVSDAFIDRTGQIHTVTPSYNKFKDAYSDLPKNDAVDAFVIADNLRFGRITPAVYMDDYRYKALQNLTRDSRSILCSPKSNAGEATLHEPSLHEMLRPHTGEGVFQPLRGCCIGGLRRV
ncbi:MAG: IS110 family transposase [Oscillospiraceae bacterium]|nr:IS110 family transposase [Oscillospiraceae bacterium]